MKILKKPQFSGVKDESEKGEDAGRQGEEWKRSEHYLDALCSLEKAERANSLQN